MSKIEWTDATWNPITGCTKVSAGCKHCYAETVAKRFWKGRPFGDVSFHPDRLEQPLRWRKPRMVFVNSMSDLFHESVSNVEIARVFFIMIGEASAEPSGIQLHTFQILTKRPRRMLEWFAWAREQHDHSDPEIMAVGLWALHQATAKNLWLGVSIEDQATADERIPLLLQAPAAVRFVSYEPALGPVDLPWVWPVCNAATQEQHDAECIGGMACEEIGIDWVIVGGESGPKARPMHPDWARSVRDQCTAAGVPFFFKQLGSYAAKHSGFDSRKGGDPDEWPEDLRVRELWRSAFRYAHRPPEGSH